MDNPSQESVEVTNVESAAAEIERRMTANEDTEVAAEETTNDPKGEAVEVEEEAKSEQSDEVSEDDKSKDEVSDDQEPDSEEANPQFSTIDELAEALDIPVEEFLKSIKGKYKINGEEIELSLAEMRDGHQREADYRRKTMDLAEKRKEFEAESENNRAILQSRIVEAARLTDNLNSQLMADANSIDWNELRESDPAEFAAKQTDFKNREAQLMNMQQQNSDALAHQAEENRNQQQKQIEEHLRKESSALMDKLPTWQDQEVASKEQKEILSFLKEEYGFTANDLELRRDDFGNITTPGITEHRIILMARDAMKGKNLLKDVDLVKAKVKKLPKILKPGNKVSQKSAQAQKLLNNRNRMLKSGSTDDLAAYLMDRI